MADLIEDLPYGICVSGPGADFLRQCITTAARKLDIQLAERDGCFVFDDDDIALKVMIKALEVARGGRP
jgi:hypothetical protein